MKVDNHIEGKIAAKAISQLGFNKAIEREPCEPKADGSITSALVKTKSKRALLNALKKHEHLLVNLTELEKYWRDDELFAALKGHYVELCFRDYSTAKDLGKGRMLVEKLVKRGLKYCLTSGATDEFELRSPRGLVAFGVLLGLTQQQAYSALGEIK